ncbi:MAG TPA: choice-of-anchor tandem repeat GloVer-containing protein, partial [Chitinophagales bacterium]|nr:choice-of-anchor tandem repeat GloVer-containing protein [Chitinophagales bacterium]
MMRKLYPTLVLLLTFFITTNAQFTKLLDLYDAGNGTDPLGGLVSDGTYFYGTTQYGGLYDKGTIYKVRPDGTGYVRLLNFDGTTTPRAPLNTLYYDGTFLYGVTLLGGANNKGVVYKIKTDGTAFSILLDFNTSTFGEIPRCSLISDGIWLYGTTFLGGSNTYGGFFKVKLDGTASAAYPIFNTTGGYSPATGLVSDGTALYGITSLGGTNGVGTIYKVLGDGTGFTKLFDMNSSVTGWNNGVIFGSMVYDGTFLYGVCRVGGANNLGTIFKIQTNGTGFVKLHDFTLATGTTPQSSLKLVGNTLYGMTSAGGANDKGVVFKINTDGSAYTVMHDFAGSPDGATPINDFYYDGTWLYAPVSFGGYSNNGTLIKIKPDGTGYGLVFDFSGISGVNPSTHGTFAYDGTSLYALTTNGGSGTCTGGCGTAFKIKPDGTYGSLYTFITSAASGRNPKGSLLYDGTYLYGTTESSNTSWGSIFKMLPDGSDFTKIYDFGAGTGLIGYSPTGSLVSDGTYLYGTTKSGGTNSKGTLFKIMPDGTNFSKIFDFSGAADGASPQGSLLYDGAYLYGTTAQGGTTNNGTVFKILPNGTGYTRLVDFDGTIGTQPVSSLITDGTWLYGTIPNGAVYKVKPDGTGFTVLHQFTG